MTLQLQQLATTGETAYITKHNNNYSAIQAAINALQSQMSGTVASNLTAPNAFTALFGTVAALITNTSYVASVSGTNVNVSAGFAWLPTPKAVVSKADATAVSFSGATAGTYYIHIGIDGVPTRDQVATDAFYSVSWSGTALSSLTRLAPIVFGNDDYQNALSSTALATTYTSLTDLLEAIGAKAVNGDTAFTIVQGKLTKSVAGGTTVTLTAAESKNSFFEFTGALTANIDIVFDLSVAPRIVNIKNSTSGNFEINCKGATSGKTVAQGYSTFMHHDGANMEYAQDDPSTIAKEVAYAATLTLDWSKYDVAYVILTGDTTITHANARPGQKCLLYLEQDATGGHSVTWANTKYGTDVGGIALSSAGNKVDEIAFSYNWKRALYNVVSVSRGYDNA